METKKKRISEKFDWHAIPEHARTITKMSFLSQIQPMNTNVEHFLEQDTNPAEEQEKFRFQNVAKKLTKLSLQKKQKSAEVCKSKQVPVSAHHFCCLRTFKEG